MRKYSAKTAILFITNRFVSFWGKWKYFWKKWKYGVWYILMIPIFACLYTFFPSGFYQSTVVQEGVIQGIDDRISQVLTGVLSKRLSSSNGSSMRSLKLSCHENSNAPVARTVHSIEPFFEYGTDRKSISSVWANVTLLEQCQDGAWLQTLFNVNADILYGPHRKLHFTEFVPNLQFTAETGLGEIFDLIKTTKNHCDELKVYFPELAFKDGNCSLIMNDKETQRFKLLLDQYDQSLNGKITGQNEFLRMFYLSTVTITTLGLGDIVPIKNSTRFLVSLQSIIGLILMGLFVESVVNVTRKTKP